jgi:cell wall-associated NlpC family hydrolase
MNASPAIFFRLPERRVALLGAAQRWLGTPFRANSTTCGPQGGISCQKLVAALYGEAGWQMIEAPNVAITHAKFSRVSLVANFLTGRPEFLPLGGVDTPLRCPPPAIHALQPGDMLGFQIFFTLHHLGIYLGDGAFIHAMDGPGTEMNKIDELPWQPRFLAAWRPLELNP